LYRFYFFNVFLFSQRFLKIKIRYINININKFQQKHRKTIAINTSASVLLTEIISFLSKMTLLLMSAVI